MDLQLPRPRRFVLYIEKSPSVAELMKALAKASMEFTPVERDREETLNGKTRRFASDRAILAATKPALLKHGIVPTTVYSRSDEGMQQVVTLWYEDEYLSSIQILDECSTVRNLNGQMTQRRKYGLAHLLSIAPDEDDDGLEVSRDQEQRKSDTAASAKFRSQQLQMAKQKIAKCDTHAELNSVLQAAHKKVADGQFDQRSIPDVEQAVERRRRAIDERQASEKTPAANRG